MSVRDPSANPTPLDRASFYIEALKYGSGPGRVETVTVDKIVGQAEILLRDARVTSMTGAEVLDATEFYVRSLADAFHCAPVLVRSIFYDGLTHGIAFAAGLEGEPRDPCSG
ncbi:MAG: hypothetical protein ACLP50_29335 [Solirubrobacteraceae bacterium]